MGNGGDQLARGAHSATFETPNVSQEKWNEAFGSEEGFEERMRRKRLAQLNEEQSTQAVEEDKKVEQKLVEQKQEEKKIDLNNVPFRAILDRVVVVRLEEEEMQNGFYVPDEAKEKPQEGLVVAVGPGKFAFGQFQPVSVKPGERVLFGKYAGQEVKVGPQIFLVLREEDLFIVKNLS